MVANNLFWSHHIRIHYIPYLDAFADSVRRRFLPTFETVGEEAERISNEVWEQLGESANEYSDPADAAEQAQNAGIAHLGMMKDMEQGFLNVFTVGLYHMFEQQFLLFHRRELLNFKEDTNHSLFSVKEGVTRLTVQGIDVTKFGSWPRVSELGVLCHTIKHADGRSCEELKKLRPTLFAPCQGDDQWPQMLPYLPGLKVFGPLSGEGIYVTKEFFQEYADEVKHFWTELCDALDMQGQNA